MTMKTVKKWLVLAWLLLGWGMLGQRMLTKGYRCQLNAGNLCFVWSNAPAAKSSDSIGNVVKGVRRSGTRGSGSD